jgi:predicted membrane-bound mannosyltransferase
VARTAQAAELAVSEGATSGEISERAWLIAALGIMLVGAFLRLYNLSLVPLHHDEGVNGNFLISLVRNGG